MHFILMAWLYNFFKKNVYEITVGMYTLKTSKQVLQWEYTVVDVPYWWVTMSILVCTMYPVFLYVKNMRCDINLTCYRLVCSLYTTLEHLL